MKGMLLGANVMEKSRALSSLGLRVISVLNHPSERIDLCIAREPGLPLYVTGWGDVFLRIEFDGLHRDFRKPDHPDSHTLLNACQALISDLYGCASSKKLDALLKAKGWRCHLMGGGGVRVLSDNPLDLEAEIHGRAISPISLPGEANGEHVSRRLAARLAELTSDVNAVHDPYASGVAGDIEHYIALERQGLLS
jgi:hypothetical protein